MRAKTELGEIGIIFNGELCVFRPTLRNIANIGTPREIIEIMLSLAGGDYKPDLMLLGRMYSHYETKRLYELSMRVIEACGEPPHGMFGWYYCGKFRPGVISIKDTLLIAVALIQAGTVGKPNLKHSGTTEEIKEFHVSDYVTLATSNFGISSSDAYGMSMIEIQRALDIVFPKELTKVGDSDLTNGDYDKAMARAEALMRRSTNGK